MKSINFTDVTGGKIMFKTRSWVVIIGLLVVGIISSGCTSTTKIMSTTTVTVTPSIEFTTVTPATATNPPTTPNLVIADSFTIVPNTSEAETEWEAQHITEITQLTLPYLNYGYYFSKPFFVNVGETIQLIINSPVPAAVDENNNVGLLTDLTLVSPNTDVGPTSSNSSRTQSGFTTTFLYSVPNSGEYLFSIRNDSIQNSSCQVTVNIVN
jgi:hypothetical protein